MLAVTREDAEMLNLWGELEGDVIFALRLDFDRTHVRHLPGSRLGIGGNIRSSFCQGLISVNVAD